jgi:hypothetical protein
MKPSGDDRVVSVARVVASEEDGDVEGLVEISDE